MPDILTLTMNPALDTFTTAERVTPDHKLRCDPPHVHPGGGGINVARVVHRLGADVLAVFPVGGLTGQRLCRMLDEEGVPSLCIPVEGETRESFTVHETSTSKDWRFVLPGPRLAPAEWQACLGQLAAQQALPRMLVASGSLPPGVPDDFYATVAQWARAKGCRMVLDTSGAPLAAALQAGVFLFKPSRRELAELTGMALDDAQAQRDACRRLVDAGQAELVALSLGAEGALLVGAGEAWRARTPQVPVESTIGAGDSFLGGLVWALGEGQPLQEAFRSAMAAGAAAVLSPGTALCTPSDLRRLLAQVEVRPA